MAIKILFLGDVFLTDDVFPIKIPSSYPLIFNLEGPISHRGRPIPDKINLIMRPGLLEKIFCPLPLAVSLANNHIVDFGNEAFEDTLVNLQKLDIKYFGAGNKTNNYNNPLIVKAENTTIALLGYCYAHFYKQVKMAKNLRYGPAPLDLKTIKKDVESVKNKVDFVVVSLHWGVEECGFPESDQVSLARHIIDMGVGCIIGHHAHSVQPIERYKGGLIAYNIGNFVFPDISVPCKFDEDCQSNGHYQKIQRPWNRSSIGVLIEPRRIDCEIVCFYFNGRWIENIKNPFHRYAFFKISAHMEQLDKLASVDRKIKLIASLIWKNLEKPKIPSAKAIKGFLKAIC